MNHSVVQGALSLIGAVAGGILGYFIFIWLTRNYGALGFAIPGVAASIGGASAGRCPSIFIAIACGIIGLLAGLFSAWKVVARVGDGSFSDFVLQAHQLSTLPLVLIVLGGLIAFWFPFRRMGRIRRRAGTA